MFQTTFELELLGMTSDLRLWIANHI